MSTAREVQARLEMGQGRRGGVAELMHRALGYMAVRELRLAQSGELWREVQRAKSQGPAVWWGAP